METNKKPSTRNRGYSEPRGNTPEVSRQWVSFSPTLSLQTFSLVLNLLADFASCFTEKTETNRTHPQKATSDISADLVTSLLKTLTWLPITPSKSQSRYNDSQGPHQLGPYDFFDLISTTLPLTLSTPVPLSPCHFLKQMRHSATSGPSYLLCPVTRAHPLREPAPSSPRTLVRCHLLSEAFPDHTVKN